MSVHTFVGDSMSIHDIPNSPKDPTSKVATLDSIPHTVDVENPSSELKQEAAQRQTPSPNIDSSQSTEAFKEIIQAAKFGDLSRIKNIINSLPPQDFQMNPESSVNTVLLNSTAATEADVDIVVAVSPSSQQAPTSYSSSGEDPKTGGSDIKELTGPSPSQPPPVAQLTSVVPPTPISASQLSQPMDLSTCTEVNLSVTVWNNSGDLLPISLSHPDYPPIVLQLKTDPPAPYGNTISLNFTPEWVLRRLNNMLAINPSLGANGTPIIMSFSIAANRPDAPAQSASNQQQQQSLPLTQTGNPPPSRTIAIPVQAAQVETINVTPTIIQQAPPPQPPPIKPLPGTRKMRPIAPKPPASSNTMSAGLAGLSSIRSSSGRNARKIISTAPVTISAAAPIAPNPPLNAAVTLIPNANLNSRGVSGVSSSSNNNARNRNRRKNATTTNVAGNIPLITITTLSQMSNSIPVAITNNPPTAIIPQTGGYVMDNSGNLIAADNTTVTGGFMQPIMHTGVSNGTAAQLFTPAGQLLVNGPNGSLIPMAMLPSVEARPSDAETGDLQQNSYQTLLVHADGSSSEGYAQQVYFRSDGTATTNGTGTQQFIMTHQGYQAANQEFQMQSFQTATAGQPTEFIQSNGGGTFIIDGSCYMQYYGGQVQPVESVEIRDAPVEGEEEDILDTAMRVAREGCPDNEVVNLNQFTEDGASNNGSMINDFMQQQSASNTNPDTEYADQQQQQQVEDLTGSTGDAKIDALLAEAALVSSVNGVGDNQSAVSVPVTSLLGNRVGNAESNTNETMPLNAVPATTDVNTNDEFPQALYDSFANFSSTTMQGDNLPSAPDTNAFNYMSQEVNLESDFCGATTVDLDASSSQNDADSFLKNLASQVDEMSAEFSAAAAKGEIKNHNSSEQNQPSASGSVSFSEHVDEDAVVTHFDEAGDDNQGTSHHQVDDMEDILRAVDDDVDEIFLNRDYDVDGFGLLDPSSPLRVPDSLTEPNAPESDNRGLLHPVDDISINDSLLPPDLTLQSVSVFESSPPPPVATNATQDPPTPIKRTLPEDSGDDSDSSGSELDFLPSRVNRQSNEIPPQPSVVLTNSVEPQVQYSSSPLSSPQQVRKSPRRSPRQSTPRRKLDKRSSTPSVIPLSPLRRSTRRGNSSRQASENSSTPVSPNIRRSLRSSAAKRLEDDDDLARALTLSDSETVDNSFDAARNPDTTFETEPQVAEESYTHPSQESNQLQSSRNERETSFSSPLTDSPYSHLWFLSSERPKSFGLTNITEVPTPVPVNKIPRIGLELELKDNPVLQSDASFWGNTASTGNTNTTEDEEDNSGKQLVERRPQDSICASSDDSDSDSILSLQAAVRAGSFTLNVSFNSPLTLPHDNNTFSRFADSPSLQSFDTLAVIPPSISRSHYSPPSVVKCANDCPADSDQAAPSIPENEDSSDGTITPNSCIPDPANLSFSETLFPPKFPSISKISTKPIPILQNCATSTSFSSIAEAAVNPPKIAEEILSTTSQEQLIVVEENMNGDTEHLAVQSVIIPSTSLVPPVATMVTTTMEAAGRSNVAADYSTPAVEIIDLCPTPSPFKEPLRMKINLSSIRSHHHRHRKEKRGKGKKNKKKESQQAATALKRIRPIEETAADSKYEPTPPKVGKLIISRVGDSYHRQPITSDVDKDGCESFRSVVGSNFEPFSLLSSPIIPAYMNPRSLINKPKRGRGRPITKGGTTGTRGRPRGSRGIGRGIVQRGKKGINALPESQQKWPSPSPVDVNKASSPEVGNLANTIQPTEPPTNAGRKFFSSSKEDRRSSAITKNRSWRSPYVTTVRKRGRYSGPLFTRDRRNSQSQNQQQSVSIAQSAAILPPSATANLPLTEPLRVRIRMNTNESSSGQPSGNSQAGTASEQLQATEGSTILTTSNPDEEQYHNEIGNLEAQSRPQSQGDGGVSIFFVAPEAETFVDKNQARVRVVVNRAACLANGVDPGLSDDDDSEDDDNNEDDNESGDGGNGRRLSPDAPPSHRPSSSNPPRSHGGVDQHQQSSYRGDHHSTGQPQSYSSSQTPSFNHQPAATPVFTSTRCDMNVSSSAAATHQHVQPTTTATRTPVDTHESARSSSTASGSLPAPSTISPAPFTLSQASNNEVVTDNRNESNFYQRQRQMSSGRQFAEMRHPSPSPQGASTFHQQQPSREAFAAAYAAMFANPYFLMPPYATYGQSDQQPSRDMRLESHSNTLHHHLSSQQDDHQRIPPSYHGDGSSTNEAHQNHNSFSLTSNFSNRIPERDALNYYAWNAQHQYHHANAIRSTDRYSYPTVSSPFPSQNSSSANHSGITSAGAASQWYQGVARSSEQPGVVTQPPLNSTSNYPQLDDSVVAAAVAARYRLSP
ncbi:unnamed protein product [Rodentolepis nana]|uniref:C3H1-type domain-containing protein n=1 Tax=Rodentolepis nana TaxID=102285 RepID=A0A0R3TP07_RODNA|nr:unnamed protein product [Rodentolepis nana]